MKTKRTALVMAVAFWLILFSSGVGLAQTTGPKETFFLSGIVKEVSTDYQWIVLGDRKFFISHDTNVVDENGKRLRLGDIKKNADVAIDAIQHPNGYIIKMIVIITNKGV